MTTEILTTTGGTRRARARWAVADRLLVVLGVVWMIVVPVLVGQLLAGGIGGGS